MKGIPFSPEMALALREGRKYETRRVATGWLPCERVAGRYEQASRCLDCQNCRNSKGPRYKPGDVCFVQESFTTYHKNTPEEDAAKLAAVKRGIKSLDDLIAWSELPTGGGQVQVLYKSDFGDWADDPDSDLGPWKSPRFMPAWAARTFVEITSVRVERVRDISIHAALLEGLRCPDCGYTSIDAGFHMDHGICVNRWLKRAKAGSEEDHSLIASFRELWNRLHPKAPYRFEDDPWVWVHGLKEVPRP